MSANIHIGDTKIPVLDYAVSCNAILGIRDSGKTVTAKRIAEQLIECGIPIIVFDPVGKWRWLKTPAPGGRGYKVVVAGGAAPDVPLTVHSVGEIVRSAVREKISLVIDLYDRNLSKQDWKRIVKESIRIIHYEANGVMHVLLEEAAEYVPQQVRDGDVYAEVEKLARMGGNASVGITLINQRSQEINKAVLELAHNLILGCQIGNKAIESVGKWMDRLSPDIAKRVETSLPKLKSGEAWVWVRSNPDEPSFEKMPMCKSLHPDRRTPDVVLKSAKPIDTDEFVARLKQSIPKVIEEAKNNDPAELKRQITQLKKQLAAVPVTVTSEPERVEIPVLTEREAKALGYLIDRVAELKGEAVLLIEGIDKATKETTILRQLLLSLTAGSNKIGPARVPTARPVSARTAPVPRQSRLAGKVTKESGDLQLTGAQQRVLDSLMWWESLGEMHPDLNQVGAMALLDPAGGHFQNTIGPLSSSGLIERDSGHAWLTDEGRALAKVPADQTTLGEYHDVLRERIRKMKNANGRTLDIFNAIVANGFKSISLEEISDATGLDHNGGHFQNSIGPLSTVGFITRKGGMVTPNEILFPEGL